MDSRAFLLVHAFFLGASMWLSLWCFKRSLVIGVGMISGGCVLADVSMKQLFQASCATLVILLTLDCATSTVSIYDKDDSWPDTWPGNRWDTWPGNRWDSTWQDENDHDK